MRNRRFRIFFIVALCLVLLGSYSQLQVKGAINDEPNEYRIVIEADVLDEVDRPYVKYVDGRYYVLSFRTMDEVKSCYKKYQKETNAQAEYVEKAHVSASGMEGYQYLSWGAEKIHCDKISKALLEKYKDINNMPEITVGIIDSGIDYNHSFFANRSITAKYDFVQNDGDAMDVLGHGTHVAGIIVDSTLPNVKLNAYQVTNAKGEAYIDDIAKAIQQAIDDHVDIINMSLGAELPKDGLEEQLLKEVLDRAIERDIVVVTAAGNGDENGLGIDIVKDANIWPANYSSAITVSAVDRNMQRAFFSNYGNVIDLCAPGVDVNSSYYFDSYKIMSGTSMACPFVVGAVALILTDDPTMTYDQVADALKKCAVDLGMPGFDPFYGFGMVDLEKWQIHENKAYAMDTESTEKVTLQASNVNEITNYENGINIRWKKSSNSQGYYIYRKKAQSTYQKVKTIKHAEITSYIDKNVKNGEIYQYKVVPYYEKTLGECKKTLKVMRLSPIKCKALKKNGAKSVEVSYSKNKKATGYQIQYSKSKAFDKKKVVTIYHSKDVIAKISNLKQGEKYFVRVRCFYKKGNVKSFSAWSGKKSICIKK